MSKRLRFCAVISLLQIAGLAAAADPNRAQTTTSEPAATAMERTVLTQHDRTRASLWGLSAEEWQRYRTLMEGIRGSISPDTLSPIEVLGIHARDDAERQRYAERWAIMMREDAERILAFQRAYDAAGRRLFPNETLIDIARLARLTDDNQTLRRSDRVLLFTQPDCAACDALLARALARLDRLDGVDVFLSGVAAGDEGAIRDWARERGIRPDWVTARRVTLNFDGGALARVAPGRTDLPVLLRRRGESVTPLASTAL